MKAFIQRSARDDIFGRDEFDAVLPAPQLVTEASSESEERHSLLNHCRHRFKVRPDSGHYENYDLSFATPIKKGWPTTGNMG
ncbi:hypothetical protein [Methylocystis suflitae]|uniref:hypothetical protein n=1 Tax=Methylocystis suflitae TaxID=2951405 RepID=UPI0021093A30|nr:hypothetical protein [Methylocystis suflitae]MCQ4191374.1 hypothetical protein [Methylocystis suflitae]